MTAVHVLYTWIPENLIQCSNYVAIPLHSFTHLSNLSLVTLTDLSSCPDL